MDYNALYMAALRKVLPIYLWQTKFIQILCNAEVPEIKGDSQSAVFGSKNSHSSVAVVSENGSAIPWVWL